jgi:hypothetical protein
MRITRLVAVTALTIGATAQTPPSLATASANPKALRIWEIPALGYTVRDWSSVKLTNDTDSVASFQVDAYCGRAKRLSLDPTYTVEPHQASEVRISAETIVTVQCWVRVSQLTGELSPRIQIRASVDVLNGNRLEEFDRQPRQASADSFWAIPEPEIGGQQLYILNTSETATILTFCVAKKPDPKECQRKGANPVRRLAKPRQAVILDVNKFPPKNCLIAESSDPGSAILQVFNADPGHRKFYSAESSISFDTPEN